MVSVFSSVLLYSRLTVASATFPNPNNELTLKPLPANNSSPSVCTSTSTSVSQNWTNSLPTNNGLHHATKTVTFSPVVCTNSKENTVSNLTTLPALPALNKTSPSSMVHINKNSNITVKLGEEVQVSLLNHVTSAMSQQNLSLHNAVSSMVSPQHGTVLITKQGGNMLFSKPVVSEGNVIKQMVTLASSSLSVTSTTISAPLSTTNTVTSVSVMPMIPSVTNIGQSAAVNDVNSLLGKRPKTNVVKTEEVYQGQQQTIPALVSG